MMAERQGDGASAGHGASMRPPHRCLVIVPTATPDLYARLVAAFADDPQVFVLRDRRGGQRAIGSVGVFAVGGGELDAALRKSVDDTLRGLGVARGPSAGT
jgi:hypothetical protein